MTTIKTTCTECLRDVEMPPRAITVFVGSVSLYAFACPACGQYVEREASERVKAVLLATQEVTVEEMDPPLSEGEVDRFGLELGTRSLVAIWKELEDA